MEIIEINEKDWTEKPGLSSTGKRVKAWYERNSDGKIFLHKEPKNYTEINFITFEIWTEIIANHIGVNLGLEIPKIYPAKDQNNYGVLIEYFLNSDEELREAKDFLQTFEVKPSHNIALIEKFLKNLDKRLHLWNCFKKMLIYDCLIGNNDRHDENWGLCFNFKEKKVRFAPIYDNASCLTRELTEKDVENILNNQQKFEKYIFGKKARPPNLFWDENDTKKYNHFELMVNLIKKELETKQIIEKFLQIDYINSANFIMEKIRCLNLPEEYKLSDNRVKAISKILESRKAKLQELL
ncbi:MAG: HipA domain-containing protein [bacterium]